MPSPTPPPHDDERDDLLHDDGHDVPEPQAPGHATVFLDDGPRLDEPEVE